VGVGRDLGPAAGGGGPLPNLLTAILEQPQITVNIANNRYFHNIILLIFYFCQYLPGKIARHICQVSRIRSPAATGIWAYIFCFICYYPCRFH
jgi:hypothetical protein